MCVVYVLYVCCTCVIFMLYMCCGMWYMHYMYIVHALYHYMYVVHVLYVCCTCVIHVIYMLYKRCACIVHAFGMCHTCLNPILHRCFPWTRMTPSSSTTAWASSLGAQLPSNAVPSRLLRCAPLSENTQPFDTEGKIEIIRLSSWLRDWSHFIRLDSNQNWWDCMGLVSKGWDFQFPNFIW